MRKRGKLGIYGALGLLTAGLWNSGCTMPEKEIEFEQGLTGYQLYTQDRRPPKGSIEARLAFHERGAVKKLVVYDDNLEKVQAKFDLKEVTEKVGSEDQKKVTIKQTYPFSLTKKEDEKRLAEEKEKGRRIFSRITSGGHLRYFVTDNDCVESVYWLADEQGKIPDNNLFLGNFTDPSRIVVAITRAGKDGQGNPERQTHLLYDHDDDGWVYLSKGSQSVQVKGNRIDLQDAIVVTRKVIREEGVYASLDEAIKKDEKIAKLEVDKQKARDKEEVERVEKERQRQVQRQLRQNFEEYLTNKFPNLSEGDLKHTLEELTKIGVAVQTLEERAANGKEISIYLRDPKNPHIVYEISKDRRGLKVIQRPYEEIAKDCSQEILEGMSDIDKLERSKAWIERMKIDDERRKAQRELEQALEKAEEEKRNITLQRTDLILKKVDVEAEIRNDREKLEEQRKKIDKDIETIKTDYEITQAKLKQGIKEAQQGLSEAKREYAGERARLGRLTELEKRLDAIQTDTEYIEELQHNPTSFLYGAGLGVTGLLLLYLLGNMVFRGKKDEDDDSSSISGPPSSGSGVVSLPPSP